MDAEKKQQIETLLSSIDGDVVAIVARGDGSVAINNTSCSLPDLVCIHAELERTIRRLREGIRTSIHETFGDVGLEVFNQAVAELSAVETDQFMFRRVMEKA